MTRISPPELPSYLGRHPSDQARARKCLPTLSHCAFAHPSFSHSVPPPRDTTRITDSACRHFLRIIHDMTMRSRTKSVE